MRRWFAALALAGLLAGCVGGATDSPTQTMDQPSPTPTTEPSMATSGSDLPGDGGASPAPRNLTPANDGAVYSMAFDQPVALVVPDPLAPDPVVEGTSIELIEVVNIQASGQREWEVAAIAPGRSVVSGASRGVEFTITIDVDG